jgi:hypothetical protein
MNEATALRAGVYLWKEWPIFLISSLIRSSAKLLFKYLINVDFLFFTFVF